MIDYDKYIVAFSGGKDSTALLLHLLDLRIPKHKIELWHHDIDGGGETFMDWEITHDYCQKFADAFGVPIFFSHKEGGFKREMMRDQQLTAPIHFQDENHEWHQTGGIAGKLNTRLKFPQVSPDLSVRWCSAYLKIDVMSAAIRNMERFKGIRTVVLSGERGEESSARSKYAILEPDRADLRNSKTPRYVDRWRPIRDWAEQMVWEIIQKHSVRVHPAYYLGWGRVSCKFCIFGNANQFASAHRISPEQSNTIINLENDFGVTIKRKTGLKELIDSGKPYEDMDEEIVALATGYTYTENIIIGNANWCLPKGAYGESCGPI